MNTYPNSYQLFIFDKPANFEKYALLEREAALIPNYRVIKLDIDSTEAFYPKISYRCREGMCALADQNGGLVVRFNKPPISFFDLREKLLSLGYRSYAHEIHWNTTSHKADTGTQ